MTRTYTHPDVFDKGVREGWADPIADPALIDWAIRQAEAAIPFRVVDGRPVNPHAPTGIRYGRNELGHWGEQLAADAVVTATDQDGRRWLAMVERRDGHGWALPGGYVEAGESAAYAAIRELAEETGLTLPGVTWQVLPARYVPDPRASDEAWMVTVPARVHLGTNRREAFPALAGADDAKRAAWVRADTVTILADYLHATYRGVIFAAHQAMLTEFLTAAAVAPGRGGDPR
ncbi:NUDIX domain-containing protein [Sphaerisporangium corydalis]|uniref:NUDIX domain-containing protein n=1 Tax=Sphaerisporangium corydalis TaxID=1441875 RepID=A0ABV9EGG5_9ACTN|nr:NUDIX domain-containing protein [Sphaerisporangium corydalis]